MFSLHVAKRSGLPTIVGVMAAVLTLSTLTGCVAFVPYLKPDAQARGDGPKKVCPLSGFTPGIPGPDGDAPVSRMLPQPEQQRRSRTEARIEQLIFQLADKESAVRTNAATDLGNFGIAAEIAVEPLANSVKRDPSEWVRRAAVKSLAKIGTPDVIEPLRLARNDRNKWVAHSATNALRKLGYSESSVIASRGQSSRGQLARPSNHFSQAIAPASAPVYQARGDNIKKL